MAKSATPGSGPIILFNNILDTERHVHPVLGDRVRIGRDPTTNDLVLDDSPLVGERHAELIRRGDGWELLALGVQCEVDGVTVPLGERALLTPGRTFRVPLFEFLLEQQEAEAEPEHVGLRLLEERTADLIRTLHVEVLDRLDWKTTSIDRLAATLESLVVLEKHIEEVASRLGVGARGEEDLTYHIAGHCIRSEILSGLIASGGGRGGPWEDRGDWSQLVTRVEERERELLKWLARLRGQTGLDDPQMRTARGEPDLDRQMDAVELRFWDEWNGLRNQLFLEDRRYLALRQLKTEIKDIIFGYGPLQDLLRLPPVTEIMVIDSRRIYIEKGGVIRNSGRRFVSDDVTIAIIQRIVGKVGRQISPSHPLVDARLTDGSRVNAVIEPLAVSGPCLTVRKFSRKWSARELVAQGTMTSTLERFLRACVEAGCNILVAGGTGSGKTTFLNCLSEFIPDEQRIVTIEDTTELRLEKEHVVRLEAKPATAEGKTSYEISDLVRNALRMRPDRIVVGECRGGEALDMLQAMNTGHDGSMTTIHANAPEDVVQRLEVLVHSSSRGRGLPVSSIRQQVASAVDLVVQLRRMRHGARRVVQVTEYLDVDAGSGEVRMKDLFRLEGEGMDATLEPTGCLPTFMARLMSLKTNSIDWRTVFAAEHEDSAEAPSAALQ